MKQQEQKRKRGRPIKWELIPEDLAAGGSSYVHDQVRIPVVRSLVHKYNKENPDTFFSVRQADNGRYKIWRLR